MNCKGPQTKSRDQPCSYLSYSCCKVCNLKPENNNKKNLREQQRFLFGRCVSGNIVLVINFYKRLLFSCADQFESPHPSRYLNFWNLTSSNIPKRRIWRSNAPPQKQMFQIFFIWFIHIQLDFPYTPSKTLKSLWRPYFVTSQSLTKATCIPPDKKGRWKTWLFRFKLPTPPR